MAKSHVIYIIFNLIVLFSKNVYCDRQKIYFDLNSRHFCFRRLNATHETGCQSSNEPVGILHLIKDQKDVLYITKDGPNPPYVPIVQIANLSTNLLLQFKNVPDRIAGVLVLRHPPTLTDSVESIPIVKSLLEGNDDESTPSVYSPETSCPNSKFSLYPESECQTPWVQANAALEMMSYSYPFPMILLTQQNDTNRVVNCFLKFNFEASSSTISTSWPLCAAEITSLMNAAVNTPKCIARSEGGLFGDNAFCAPLSSKNLFASTAPLDEPLKSNSNEVIFLLARMDSLSMFEEIAPGAYSTVAGILGVMSVAETVSRVIREQNAKPSKRILFGLLDGEAFGYIGSSALVYDITNNSLVARLNMTPINMSNIHSVIELNQIASVNNKSDIWLHTDKVTGNSSYVINDILEKLQTRGGQFKLSIKTSRNGLPPSSLMSFLKVDRSIPAIHISNHESTYITPRYNSFLDEPSANWNNEFVSHISRVSDVVSSTLLELIGVKPPPELQANITKLHDLADCLLFNLSCPLFPYSLGQETVSLYVSVANNNQRKTFIANIYDVLSKWVGRVRSDLTNQEACTSQKTNFFLWSNNVCTESYTFLTLAKSPAFLTNELNSSTLSTWTESYWGVPSARIFLISDPKIQWFSFFSGSLLVIATWLIVTYLERNHSTLFV